MRKRTKRKVWALVNPIQHAIEGVTICNDDFLSTLRTRELAAIEAFAKGHAGIQEWRDLAAMMNVCGNLAKTGIGPEALPDCKKAQEHLIEAAQRFEEIGKMGLSGSGLQTMRDVYQWHDLQRTSITRKEYDDAIKDTVNRIRGKAPEVIELQGRKMRQLRLKFA